MKIILIILLALSGKWVAENTNNILPTYIKIEPESAYSKELLIYVKLGFQKYHIKTIGKDKMTDLMQAEIKRVYTAYHASGGDLKDFEKIKSYQSLNNNSVANILTIRILIDNLGNFPDTIKWDSHTVPFNFAKLTKLVWKDFFVNKKMEGGAISIIQALVDSIIVSKRLTSEK